MSIVDKVIAAVTPPESQEARDEARAKARAACAPGSWLPMVLDHHVEIEQAFAQVGQATDATARLAAHQRLASILNAHSIAEELVLYPAMALNDEKGHAAKAYLEQSATKIQMAALEKLDPMSEDYADKLEHIRGAVAHHMYQEEGDWMLDLDDKSDASLQQQLAGRYREEFDRYMQGGKQPAAGAAGARDVRGGGLPPAGAVQAL